MNHNQDDIPFIYQVLIIVAFLAVLFGAAMIGYSHLS